jgi:hypothetical protein
MRIAITSLLSVTGLCVVDNASADWSVSYLHPAAAAYSYVDGVAGVQQAGYTSLPGLGQRGLLWSGSAASWLDLTPAGATASRVYGVVPGTQVGTARIAGFDHAGIWNGSAGSWTDLHPTGLAGSYARAVHNGVQVGTTITPSGNVRAAIWFGTAASWMDLTPPGSPYSEAYAVSDGVQVGTAQFGNTIQAVLWTGSATSYVNLQPAGASSSGAQAVAGARQAGSATFGGVQHAGIWSGSAASWRDLHPPAATDSFVLGMHGNVQVGVARVNGVRRASLWRGDVATWEDLSSELSGQWSDTYATSVWADSTTLHVGGWGFNLQTGRSEALLWTHPIPGPSCAAVFLMSGVLSMRRRRRRVSEVQG